MCGFLVIYSKNNFKDNFEIKDKFRSAVNLLRDRGPDDLKIIEFNNFLIGFTRLSINNIKTGSQPVFSKCKRYLICFNGEIVNYKELIKSLLEKKISLTYKSEAEVILTLYLHYKEKCISFLRGMFAFVIVDKVSGKIFAATDRFGIKPLYYGSIKNKKNFFLTSNFSPLVTTKIISKNINDKILEEFVGFGQIYGNNSLIDQVYDLKNANILKFYNNKLEIKKYWLPTFEKGKIINNKYHLDQVINKLKSVISYWQTSEERLSLCLSDGVDSQILLNLLVSKINNLKTFTIGLNPKKSNFVKKTYSNSSLIKFDLKKALKLFRSYSTKNFIPLPNPSDLTLFQLYHSISEKSYKVTFTGEGADEIFGGYNKYQKILKDYYQDSKLDFFNYYSKIYSNTVKNISLISKIKVSKNIIFDKPIYKKMKNLEIQDKCLFMDQLHWIPAVQKRHDTIGMHFGLEVRPPFLDHDLVNLVNSLPTNLKFNLKNRKIVAYQTIDKLSKFKFSTKKYGTPSFVEEIISNKKELNQFLENFRYGILNEYFKFNVFRERLEMHKKGIVDIKIIFWRLFMLNEILKD